MARACGGSTHDRLSAALPDDLLHRILSFLPAQQVVRTTVLSKRWADVWLYATGINLSLRDFRRNCNSMSEAWNRMEDFANNLLMLHRAPCLDSFRLTIFGGYDDRRPRNFETWVRRAIKGNPLVLEVSVGLLASYLLPLPHLGCSPCRLTKLHLTGLSLDQSFAEHLHSCCPELKDLSLSNCPIAFRGIESDKLENLVIFRITNPSADVFAIRAPRLASLSVHLDIPFSLDAGNSLLSASISLDTSEFSPASKAMLLGSLFSVMNFELRDYQTMAGLDEVFDDIPIFHNLRTLSMKSCFIMPAESGVHEFEALGRFLQKSPNLEKLTLKSFKVVSVVELVGFPVVENLRTLCLYSCELRFHVLLRCLLSAPNLEKLTIQYCKLTDDSTGGKAKAKKTHSQPTNVARFQCPKLKCIEILHYKDHDRVSELVSFLLDISAPMITITDTSVRSSY